jgi:hypothetical protein
MTEEHCRHMYDPTGRQDVTHAASRLPYAALGLWGHGMEIGQSRQSNQATRHGSAFTQRARLGHRVSGCLLPPVPHRTCRISQVPRRITESSESQREVCFSGPVEVLMKHSPRISVRESRAEERNVNSDGNLGWLDLVSFLQLPDLSNPSPVSVLHNATMKSTQEVYQYQGYHMPPASVSVPS